MSPDSLKKTTARYNIKTCHYIPLLTAHRVDGYQPPCDINQLEQTWNGCDFVAFLVYHNAPQAKMVGARPHTYHVNKSLGIARLVRPAERFAINGQDLPT